LVYEIAHPTAETFIIHAMCILELVEKFQNSPEEPANKHLKAGNVCLLARIELLI